MPHRIYKSRDSPSGVRQLGAHVLVHLYGLGTMAESINMVRDVVAVFFAKKSRGPICIKVQVHFYSLELFFHYYRIISILLSILLFYIFYKRY